MRWMRPRDGKTFPKGACWERFLRACCVSELPAAGTLAPANTTMPNTADANAMTPATPVPAQQQVLDQLGRMDGKHIETLSAAEAREQPSPADAVRALLAKQGKSTAPEAVGQVTNRKFDNRGVSIPIRIYTPIGTGPFPVVVYYHGGSSRNTCAPPPTRTTCASTSLAQISGIYRRQRSSPHKSVHCAPKARRSQPSYVRPASALNTKCSTAPTTNSLDKVQCHRSRGNRWRSRPARSRTNSGSRRPAEYRCSPLTCSFGSGTSTNTGMEGYCDEPRRRATV